VIAVKSIAVTMLLLVVIATTASAQSYTAQPAPKLPFFDWNACPFEGCKYGEWMAAARVAVFDTWKPNRKRVGILAPKSVVTGISGVVITYRPGVIVLTKALPDDDLRSGDRILTYTYRGEGVSAAWFKGRFYHDYDISFAKGSDGTGCLRDCKGAYVDLGKTVWWAKVQIRPGVVGWVNMNEAKFDGVDALATLVPQAIHGMDVTDIHSSSQGWAENRQNSFRESNRSFPSHSLADARSRSVTIDNERQHSAISNQPVADIAENREPKADSAWSE